MPHWYYIIAITPLSLRHYLLLLYYAAIPYIIIAFHYRYLLPYRRYLIIAWYAIVFSDYYYFIYWFLSCFFSLLLSLLLILLLTLLRHYLRRFIASLYFRLLLRFDIIISSLSFSLFLLIRFFSLIFSWCFRHFFFSLRFRAAPLRCFSRCRAFIMLYYALILRWLFSLIIISPLRHFDYDITHFYWLLFSLYAAYFIIIDWCCFRHYFLRHYFAIFTIIAWAFIMFSLLMPLSLSFALLTFHWFWWHFHWCHYAIIIYADAAYIYYFTCFIFIYAAFTAPLFLYITPLPPCASAILRFHCYIMLHIIADELITLLRHYALLIIVISLHFHSYYHISLAAFSLMLSLIIYAMPPLLAMPMPPLPFSLYYAMILITRY